MLVTAEILALMAHAVQIEKKEDPSKESIKGTRLANRSKFSLRDGQANPGSKAIQAWILVGARSNLQERLLRDPALGGEGPVIDAALFEGEGDVQFVFFGIPFLALGIL